MTALEVVDVEHHEPDALLEAARALDLAGDRVLEAAAVGEAGEVVGDGLALDDLVQADVLERHGRLTDQVVEEVALLGRERLPARDRHDAADEARLAVAPQWMREGTRALRVGAVRIARAQNLGLGEQQGLHHAVQPNRPRRPPERSVLVAQTRAATGGADAVLGGVDDDVEQRVAVEVGGERLADPAHRDLEALLLRADLLEARFELLGHRVELLAEGGELVVAVDRDLGREVTGADALGGVEEVRDLALERARDQEREREREDEEADQDDRDELATVFDRVRSLLGRVQQRDAGADGAEPGRGEGRGAIAAVADLDVATLVGRRQLAHADAGDARGDDPAVAGDDGVLAGDRADQGDVVAGGLRRDLERAEVVAVGVLERDAGREDRERTAAVGERRAVGAVDGDPRELVEAAELDEALLDRGRILAADGGRRGRRRGCRCRSPASWPP